MDSLRRAIYATVNPEVLAVIALLTLVAGAIVLRRKNRRQSSASAWRSLFLTWGVIFLVVIIGRVLIDFGRFALG